jgi:hypothetical protein
MPWIQKIWAVARPVDSAMKSGKRVLMLVVRVLDPISRFGELLKASPLGFLSDFVDIYSGCEGL